MQENTTDDEQVPRSKPKQSTKYGHLPWSSVSPELSMILDKSVQSRNMNTPPRLPESRTNISQDEVNNVTETYATWKAKKFPQQFSKHSSNNFHQVHSSTQNSSDVLSSHTPRRSINPKNLVHANNYNHQYQGHEKDFYSENNDVIKNRQHSSSKSYNRNERSSPDIVQSNAQVIESHDTRPKPTYRSSHPDASSYLHRSLPIENDRQLKMYKPASNNCHCEHSHQQSSCCTHSHNNSSTDTETVKNLLQVITSQNEQIKNLQNQLRRLLRIHEQSLKDSKKCPCQSSNYVYQNTHLYDQSRTSNLPIAHNLSKDKERCFNNLEIQDENKNPQAFLEKKVSIGVMTSFELKLQNNPSASSDNEAKQTNHQEKVLPVLDTSNKIKNLVNNTEEMIRKSQNFFTPTVLENISEGSESHMSSHRQSHLFSDTMRQSNEVHYDSPEVQTQGFNKVNSSRNQNTQRHLQSKRHKNLVENKNHRAANNLDYELEDVPYERVNNDYKEKLHYQNNNHYNDSQNSSFEDLREKPFEEFNSEPLSNGINKIKISEKDNLADDCLSLSSDEIDLDDFSPESPEQSIHVDLQEYSSEGGSLPPQRTGKVGWTICNNVLDQVNQILQNAPVNENFDQEFTEGMRNERLERDANPINKVKAATYEQLKNFGVSISEMEHREPAYSKRVILDTTYYPVQVPEAQMATSASIETNTSMYINALAMKYVKEEQVADLAMPKPRFNQTKQVPYNIQNTNMSFASMQYLQRYNLIPGVNPNVIKEPVRKDYRDPGAVYNERLVMKAVERREASPQRYPHPRRTSATNVPSKILDVTALKQRPKLL